MSEKLASLKKVGGGSGFNTLIIDNNGGGFASKFQYDIDLKNYLPNDYQNLTIDNFFTTEVACGWDGYIDQYAHGYDAIISTYTPNTGILHCNVSGTYSRQINYQWFVWYKIAVIY